MFRKWLLAPVIRILKGMEMNQAELAQTLDTVATELGAVSDQLQKGIDEVVAAVGNTGSTSPEVDAALSRLQGVADALKTKTQALDDLNPDAPPAGGGDTLPGGEDTTPGNP